jgi:hypothetical protein
VADACELLERIYGGENCNLKPYSQNYASAHGLSDLEQIQTKIDALIGGDLNPRKRFHHIMHQLLNCAPGDRLKKNELAEELSVDAKTVQRDMVIFDVHHLIKSGKQVGYVPEPKLFRLINRLQRIDAEKYNFNLPAREVYPDE